MSFSIPTLLVAAYAAFCEYKMQKMVRDYKKGEIYFLKIIDIKFRILVYTTNIGIALYNYYSGFDDYLMAGLLIITLNVVTNISKIVIESGKVTIGNTKIKQEDFTLIEIKPLDDKNAKFTFAMNVRNRRIQKDLYIPVGSVEALNSAVKQMNPAKGDKKGKSKKK